MTDLVAIAGNAVAAYQRALGTVSNNIANVATDGYSRQEVTLQANPVTKEGNIYLGSGVVVDGVKRQFDAFTEANLRNSTSDLASQEPMVNYTNRVIDVMGGQTTALTSALDQFFSSARDLSSDPASTVLRGGFVRDAEGLASRFGELSSQLDLVQSETDQAVQSAVSQINTLVDALAGVNKQLTKYRTEAAQPPDLLDQRDKLLKNLAGIVHVNTRFTENGTVKVSIGESINQDILVDGNKSFTIGANFNATSPEKINLLLDPYGSPAVLSSISGGQLSGLLSFREQVLGGARSALNTLATTMVKEVNQVHRMGIDAYGKAGGDLFLLDPNATEAAGAMKVAFTDPLRVSAAAQFRVLESGNNTSGTDASLVFVPPKFSNATPTNTLLDGQFKPGPSPINQILVNNPHPSAGRAVVVDASRPALAVATLLNGTSDASIFLENAGPGQQLQIMTRDGRQILGSPMSAELQATVLATDGMTVGAQYSDTYLNKTGETGYKDMNVFYGAKAEPRIEPVYDSLGLATSTRTWGALLEGGRMTTGLAVADLGTGTYTLNGKVLDPSTITTTTQTRAGVVTTTVQANNLAAWINATNTAPNASGVTAVASNEIHITTDKQLKLSLPLTINGIVIGVPTDGFTSKTALANQIEERKAETGVTARINGEGILILSNVSGQEGRDIQISSSAGTVGNALGVPSGLYGGVLSLSRPAPPPPPVVVRINELLAPKIDLTQPLAINGVTIPKPNTGFASIDALVAAINASQSVVVASKSLNDSIVLTSENGPDNNSIRISADSAGSASSNALGLQTNVYRAPISVSVQDTPSLANYAIEWGFNSTSPAVPAQPADLAKFGFRTGAYISGAIKDDLLIFVTGQGANGKVAASYAGKPVDPVKSARAQPLEILFTSPTHYAIRDINTDTLIAERDFDPTELNPGIIYQGLQLSFTSPPEAGDKFNTDGNEDGTGSNENMLQLANLENKAVIGSKSLGDAYIDHVNDMGNIARQATIAQSALKVVNEQAIKARDQISGVSLDQEAADLIRYQQAYQAAAKILQVGSQLFDTILQVR
jgi:flagellar hook-associated protein FlgK